MTDEPKTLAQRLATDLMMEAIRGSGKAKAEARAEIIDRTDGKAIQAVEHSGHIFRTDFCS